MSTAELWMGRIGVALMLATLVGLGVRRRWHHWFTFALMLLLASLYDALVALWPVQFYRSQFWRARESTMMLLRVAMVIELTARVFRRFPGALATARRWLAVIVVTTFAVVFAVPTRESGHAGFVGDIAPRIVNGTIWLFMGLAILILWYRLPVHWFQKAILLSYIPYLLIFTAVMNALGEMGWQRGAWANRSGPIAFLTLLIYWAYTAWRPEPRLSTNGTSGDDIA
jgi:hypothetical protein